MMSQLPYDHHFDFNIERTDAIPASRVRVLPGSFLSFDSSTTPPPPSFPPPKPSHLFKIAVVGDASTGKSSLVRKFIHRRYAGESDSASVSLKADSSVGGGNGDAGSQCTDGASSAASFGASVASSIPALEPTLADYYKKDVTIWDAGRTRPSNDSPKGIVGSSDAALIRPPSERKQVCIRVQLWDVNVHLTDSPDLEPNYSSSHPPIRPAPRNDDAIAPLIPLLTRIHGVIIVCRCPPLPHSSPKYDAWPELDVLERRIHRWMRFLRDVRNTRQRRNPEPFVPPPNDAPQDRNGRDESCISVLLNHADEAATTYSQKEWMRLSSRMQLICKKNGIDSCKSGTCIDSDWAIDGESDGLEELDDDDDDVDDSVSRVSRRSGRSRKSPPSPHLPQEQYLLLQRLWQRQKETMEDLEDAVEGTVVDMISLLLERSRRGQK